MLRPNVVSFQKTIIVIKDAKLRFVDCNDTLIQDAGIKDKNRIYGLTDYDMPWSKHADKYHQQEEDALKGNIYSSILPFTTYEGNEVTHLCTKMRRLDDCNKIIGTSTVSIEVANRELSELIEQLKATDINNPQRNYHVGKQHSKIRLSPRESQCLFYLVRGKTSKTIAKMLNISPRTAENHIENLKIKFCCFTKYELVDKAIEEGFVEIIPRNLSFENIIVGLKED